MPQLEQYCAETKIASSVKLAQTFLGDCTVRVLLVGVGTTPLEDRTGFVRVEIFVRKSTTTVCPTLSTTRYDLLV